jgi:hypothetical protein
MVGQIKVREMRRKRYKSPSPVLDRRSFADLAWDGLGMVSGGVVFSGLSKLLNQEGALGVPCLDTVIVALRRRALARRRNAADRRHPSLRCYLTVCYTGHQAGKR